MGWEQRGTNRYYYRKEREGSKVIYVGRGEIAHMISQIESNSPVLEALARTNSIEALESERSEALLGQVVELSQLFTQAALLTAGFHAHHRQWRRKRKCR